MVKGSPRSACHIQLRSSFLFLLSLWLSSCTLSEEAGCQLEKKKKTYCQSPRHKNVFCESVQNDVSLRAPRVARRQPLSFVWGWSLASEADISTQSASNRNNVSPPPPKFTHLSSVIQLRAEPHWPSCCDFVCLHGRGGVYCGNCGPLLPDAHLATGEKELL